MEDELRKQNDLVDDLYSFERFEVSEPVPFARSQSVAVTARVDF